jgi:hypothetical protein
MPLLPKIRPATGCVDVDWSAVTVDLLACRCQGVELGGVPARDDLWGDAFLRGDRFHDTRHGIELATENGLLDFIGVDLMRYPGRFLIEGAPVELGPGANERHVAELLGEPWWRDESDGAARLFYEQRGFERQFEIAPNGLLLSIGLLRTPILANAAQRAAYGVTRDWPPRADCTE